MNDQVDGLVEERYMRHWDLIDVEKLHTMPIKIIGTGSVGSFTCLALAKMGAQMIEVWDDDMIDEVNISNQFYRLSDVGDFKVDALEGLISDFENVSIVTNPVKYEAQDLEGIVICPLDSMEPRKKVWDKVKQSDNVKLFIDPRMGAKISRVYAVNPANGVEAYEKTLYSDDDSSPERCTERTIIYNVLGISSLICRFVEEYMNNEIEGCKEIIFDYATLSLMYS